jgi:hypothetical protein
MDEQLDNDLKKRIREVFDNFEDPAAEEGWLLLREKFPKKSKRRPFLWLWWSAAAIILLFLGIGLWLNNENEKPQKLVSKTSVQKHSESPKANREIDSLANKIEKISGKAVVNNTTNKVAAANNTATILKSTAKPPVNKKIIPGNLAENHTGNKSTDKNNLAANTTDSDKTTVLNPAVKQLAADAQPTTTDPETQIIKLEPQPDKKINSIFEQDKTKPEKKENQKSKRVSFGVYAATYFNYAKGSNNTINAGAGFSAEIPLTKNLRLVTGVAIAQNSLNFNGNNTIAAISQSSSFAQASFLFAAASSAAVVSRDYNVSLVGLDIPVNLKYVFNPQRNDLYISAGLSSGTFINETYTYQYNVGAVSAPIQNETSNKGFNNFYLAKTLNVAFGIGLPFGKNRLIVEPFLKYPLDGLGSQNISFGAGGLNLKFNFQSSKK